MQGVLLKITRNLKVGRLKERNRPTFRIEAKVKRRRNTVRNVGRDA